MEIFWRVLEVINWIVIVISTIAFGFQLVMILFFWLKEKHFKPSEDYHRVAVLICARNEEEVIEDTVRNILENQNYPKDKYDVYVCADNCTDQTAELARKAGAKLLIHNDPELTHHRVGYAMQYGFQQIIGSGEEYDFFIRLDADNHADPSFIREMNNAYCQGVVIGRPFEASLNGNQNTWTAVSATYYIRDSRIACNFRERFHLDSMLTGAGMMIATSVLKEIDGYWDAFSAIEDSEFTINRLMEKKRVHYVADAIVYEDQPSTMKDTWNRLTRMGNALHGLFRRKGWKMFAHFFVSGRWSNVDLFVQILMVPFTLLAFFWFVPYYVFYALCHLTNFAGTEWMSYFSGLNGVPITASVSQSSFIYLLVMAAVVIGAFLIIYPAQTFAAMAMSRKKLGWKSYKGYKRSVLLSPLFMVFYGLAVLVGVITKPKWRKIKRNPRNR